MAKETHQKMRLRTWTFFNDDIAHVLQNTKITLEVKRKFTQILSW